MRIGDQNVVLAVNAGSSSLKFGLYAQGGQALWLGAFEGLEPGGTVRGELNDEIISLSLDNQVFAFDRALSYLVEAVRQSGAHLVAVSHRIVHGGDRHSQPLRLDKDVLTYLHTLDQLAPLHQPHNLAGVEAFMRFLPDVPQIGCFDTSFHVTLPDVERRLPIPRRLSEQGLRRYGFHGLSYQYLVQILSQKTERFKGRAILAHLGNGASVCATVNGQSVATSMGFSALDGLMMGTRSGSIDAGVLLYLWRAGWTHQQVEQLLYKESGLKGVSGLSADMRTLRASQIVGAKDAIELFTHRLKREMGALLVLLGGVDVIAFTGGIGEHDSILRAALAEALSFISVKLDPAENLKATGHQIMPIHCADSSVEVWVVPTDEGCVAANAAFDMLAVTESPGSYM